ncbi:MAG: histone deacetylase [Candidatus Lokiarchaeota archaeon]|nr:histone deacetylase [Candidatus Lokiarchaeota archaeon]
MTKLTGKDLRIVTNRDISLHQAPFPKPHLEAFETPLRIDVIEDYLLKSGFITASDIVEVPRASPRDVLEVHTSYVLDSVAVMSDLGSGVLGESAYASPGLLRSALGAVGGAIGAMERVTQRETNHAFALIRPPGHHASTSSPMGLCFFNNASIAVEQAFHHEEIDRVSILDFDNHHGNGTSEIFYSEDKVQYISLHEYDYDMCGTGHYNEVGHGEAVGTNVNIPLVDGSPDVSYEEAIERIVIPSIERFEPSLIAVSAGYDSHYADPVGNMNVDSSTFWRFGKKVDYLVEETSALGSFWVLEGGYNPLVLGLSVEASLRGLKGEKMPVRRDQIERTANQDAIKRNRDIIDIVQETVELHR